MVALMCETVSTALIIAGAVMQVVGIGLAVTDYLAAGKAAKELVHEMHHVFGAGSLGTDDMVRDLQVSHKVLSESAGNERKAIAGFGAKTAGRQKWHYAAVALLVCGVVLQTIGALV